MAVRRIRVPARELSPELLDAVRAISATNDVPAEDVEVSIIDPYDGPIPEVDARAQPPNPLLNRVLGLLGPRVEKAVPVERAARVVRVVLPRPAVFLATTLPIQKLLALLKTRCITSSVLTCRASPHLLGS